MRIVMSLPSDVIDSAMRIVISFLVSNLTNPAMLCVIEAAFENNC